MKILIGTDRLSYSGIGIVTEEIARHLYERGYEVKIVCGKCDIKTKVPTILCKYNNVLSQSDIVDVIKIIKQEEPDIFHSHYYPMDLCGALINSSKIKHVMHSHGVNHQNWLFGWRNCMGLLRADIGEFLGVHLSKEIICVSNYMANELERKHRIKGDKVDVVYNTVDIMKFNPSIKGDEIREKYNISSGDLVLLCVATLAPVKRHSLLIDCLRLIIKKKKNIKLLLVGGNGKTISRYKESMISKVHDAGLQDHVIFCGSIEENLPKYYAASDLFVSASNSETFGLPFIEAMACGKPVIGFDVTAISELIIDGYNGYKVQDPNINEMATRIIQLADDTEERNRLGINGRLIARENFNAEKNIEDTIKIYSKIISCH